VIITLASAAAMIIASYLTAAPNEAQINGLTYGAVTEEDKARTRASWGTIDVIASVFVMALIVGAYVYFSG
jgi:SSS family solute:Na+ symporter